DAETDCACAASAVPVSNTAPRTVDFNKPLIVLLLLHVFEGPPYDPGRIEATPLATMSPGASASSVNWFTLTRQNLPVRRLDIARKPAGSGPIAGRTLGGLHKRHRSGAGLLRGDRRRRRSNLSN